MKSYTAHTNIMMHIILVYAQCLITLSVSRCQNEWTEFRLHSNSFLQPADGTIERHINIVPTQCGGSKRNVLQSTRRHETLKLVSSQLKRLVSLCRGLCQIFVITCPLTPGLHYETPEVTWLIQIFGAVSFVGRCEMISVPFLLHLQQP